MGNDIRRILEEKEESTKKQIAINLDEKIISELDRIGKLFTQINKSKSFSRNYLIELSVNSFIQESYKVLEEYGISATDKSTEIEEEAEDEIVENIYDLVILSSKEIEGGFVDTFLGERVWYPCRIKDERIPKIKYIAIYRGAPISGITHYAKVKDIVYDPRYNKRPNEKTTHLDGEPIELPHTITLGSKQGYHFRSPKYITLESLLNANTADELF
jgi:hypothetical protein